MNQPERRRSLREAAIQALHTQQQQQQAQQQHDHERAWNTMVEYATRNLAEQLRLDPEEIQVSRPLDITGRPAAYEVEMAAADVQFSARLSNSQWEHNWATDIYYAEPCQKFRCKRLVPIGAPISSLADLGARMEEAMELRIRHVDALRCHKHARPV